MDGLGKPDDIVKAVFFLFSNEAEYLAGQNLIVVGGRTCI